MEKYVLFLQDLRLRPAETRQLLLEAGCTHQPLWSGDSALDELRASIEILVTSEHQVPSALLDTWPSLKMVSLAFTGYNGVDRGACQRRRIHLYYVPGYSTDSVAELTVGLALSVLRKIPYGNRSLRKGYWDSGGVQPGTELTGKTVGILGTGAIGVRSAKIFNAFGCRIVGWSKTHKTEFPGEYRTELGDIFQEVDILVLHLPLNTDTEGIVNRERISLMRPGAILINTSRSGLVDTVALADAIHGYRIAGAGIDVFDQESEAASEDPLLVLKDRNVVATPHLGFKTTEALYRLSRTTIDNIGRYLRGDAQNRLEPEGKGS